MSPERLTCATESELSELTSLCLRSKAYWGYDAAFMSACEDVLQVTRDDLAQPCAVVRSGDTFAGYVRVNLADDEPELSKLFVCPNHMGHGHGTALIRWAKQQARENGCTYLMVESDPDAAPFYKHHGAIVVGEAPSEAIPNRFLPLLKLPTD